MARVTDTQGRRVSSTPVLAMVAGTVLLIAGLVALYAEDAPFWVQGVGVGAFTAGLWVLVRGNRSHRGPHAG